MKSFIKRTIMPLCGVVATLCIFVANSSPNLCLGIWGYEKEMPETLKHKC